MVNERLRAPLSVKSGKIGANGRFDHVRVIKDAKMAAIPA